MRALYLLILLLTTPVFAEDWHLVDAEKLEIKYSKLNPENRDPYAPQYTGRWSERASLLWRVSILDRLYWDNDVHTETIDTGQVKTVGWHYEIGLRLSPYIIPFMEHHSRHIMDEGPDTTYPTQSNQFPVENSYGVRIRFLEEKPGKWVFGN